MKEQIEFPKQIGKSKPSLSIKVNKDLIKARQVQACPELATAQPHLVSHFIEYHYIDTGLGKTCRSGFAQKYKLYCLFFFLFF